MAYLESSPCCAMDIIDGVDDTPQEVLRSICDEKYPDKEWCDEDEEYGSDKKEQAFIVFTDNVSKKDSGGEGLAKYIKKNKLGSFIVTRARRNPNTDHMVKVWVWTPNERNLKRWYKNI